jgi:hypothetical protein
LDNIRAGDTLILEYSNSDYSSADYDLWIALRGPSVVDLKTGVSGVTIASSGSGWTVTVTAAVTAGWIAGDYWYTVYAGQTSFATRYTAESGTLEILPSLSAQIAGYTNKSHVKTVLDAIEAVIAGRASLDQMSYTIQGRSLSKTPLPELIEFRRIYRAEYAAEKKAERVAAGLDPGNLIKVRL